MKTFRYIDQITTIAVNAGKCIGCGLCMQVCPHAVLSMTSEKRVTVTDRNACIECGACATNCPTEALKVSAGVGCASLIIAQWLQKNGILKKAGKALGRCC